jgi:hypothetical protein
MSLETIVAAAQAAEAGDLRQMLQVWRALAPARDKAGKIDWQKLLEFIQQIMPIVLALLDLLPKKPA